MRHASLSENNCCAAGASILIVSLHAYVLKQNDEALLLNLPP